MQCSVCLFKKEKRKFGGCSNFMFVCVTEKLEKVIESSEHGTPFLVCQY